MMAVRPVSKRWPAHVLTGASQAAWQAYVGQDVAQVESIAARWASVGQRSDVSRGVSTDLQQRLCRSKADVVALPYDFPLS